MTILGGVLVPHPPTLIATGEAAEDTAELSPIRQSMEVLSEKVAALKPQTLVFISPHGSCFADAFAIKRVLPLKGSLQDGKIKVDAACDLELADSLLEEARDLGVNTFAVGPSEKRFEFSLELDHGVTVPLHFLNKHISPPIVSISTSDLGTFDHYRLGAAIRRASTKLKRGVVLLASGDLSHPENPPGERDPEAEKFDKEVIGILKSGEFHRLLEMDSEQLDEIAGCGIMPLLVLLGAFEGEQSETEILGYENPFGSGYLIAQLRPTGQEKRGLLPELVPLENAETLRRRQQESPPVALARQAVEAYVRFGKVVRVPQELPEYMTGSAGTFVSLKKGKALRGCIGTTAATTGSVAEEIIQNSIHSATRDPRFYPVEEDELDHLVYSVDILHEPEEVPDASHLDHKRYGVFVKCGGRCGLLLPDIEGVNSVEEQVSIARQKGGIGEDEDFQLFRFRVKRYR